MTATTSKQVKRAWQKSRHKHIQDSRSDARWKIIQLANQHMMRNRIWWAGNWSQPRLLGARQINQAVKIVRHHRLGNPVLLQTAGFNAQGA